MNNNSGGGGVCVRQEDQCDHEVKVGVKVEVEVRIFFRLLGGIGL